jgi:hypothetical protein
VLLLSCTPAIDHPTALWRDILSDCHRYSHASLSSSQQENYCPWNPQPVRLAGGWWLVLVCSERKVLMVGCWWLVCSERKVLLAGVDAKSAPSAKHTASRTSWLHTRRESRDVPVNVSWKLTTDKGVRYQSLELAGWYQTVPYLRLESQTGWHIAMKSYLPTN